jgi:predicted RNA-binding protein with PUA-like domain
MSARCWLLKTEPESFSIDDLAASPRQTTCWDGVRNYQARNFLRDDVQLGDRVLFYHSNAAPAAVVGTALVTRAWDPTDSHFDPQASPDHPIWQMIDIRLERVFTRAVSLEELRAFPELAAMELLRRGSRLSVQPVRAEEFELIVRLGSRPALALGTLAAKQPTRSVAKSARAARKRTQPKQPPKPTAKKAVKKKAAKKKVKTRPKRRTP